jgi:hypothetical protein
MAASEPDFLQIPLESARELTCANGCRRAARTPLFLYGPGDLAGPSQIASQDRHPLGFRCRSMSHPGRTYHTAASEPPEDGAYPLAPFGPQSKYVLEAVE